jgi:cation:H+ antiporter
MYAPLLLVGGGLLLYFGAEWFVGGASRIALSLRIPQVIVGLTVVAYGTSAPEVIVSVQAALAGYGAVALGNVIGSNIANLGLILGLVAVLSPPRVEGSLPRRELPVLLGSTLLLLAVLWDGTLTRLEGYALVASALAYTAFMIVGKRLAALLRFAQRDTAFTLEAVAAAGAPVGSSGARLGVALGSAAVGLLVLLVGGRLFVDGAVALALELGLSERVVGLTIVSVGTSLPELITSLVALRRGHADLAVGNVLGSNIFNVLLCLGIAIAARPIQASISSQQLELAFLGAMTLLGAWAIRRERLITRVEGGVLLASFVAFITLTLTLD